jgi:peptidoglycan/xylan/chitin deacetylase (PgdA/CDA1 family)
MISGATAIIEKSIGKRPTSFRAGKYGVDETTLSVLESEGYLVDTSISPNINWSKNGGPDWSQFHTVQPYFRKKLLEVPLTIINFMGMNFWVRPSTSTYSAMKKIVDLIKLQHNDPIVINIMFHSMESIDPNPYIKSELFMSNLDNFLNDMKLKNAKFVTLHQLFDIFDV